MSETHQIKELSLADLPKHTYARILGFDVPADEADRDMETRLREIGFAEGDEVEALHYGPFGKTPMTVRLNGAIIALRRKEAGYILLDATKLGKAS